MCSMWCCLLDEQSNGTVPTISWLLCAWIARGNEHKLIGSVCVELCAIDRVAKLTIIMPVIYNACTDAAVDIFQNAEWPNQVLISANARVCKLLNRRTPPAVNHDLRPVPLMTTAIRVANCLVLLCLGAVRLVFGSDSIRFGAKCDPKCGT